MSYKKEDILKVLEAVNLPGTGNNVVNGGAVRNINVFGQEVAIDLVMHAPAMNTRKKVESEVVAVIKKLDAELVAKVTITHQDAAKEPVQAENKLSNVKNIVAIASGKGGVGKSTITANLAVSLAKKGFKVGLIDADIYGPSMPIMFDVEKSKPMSVNVDGASKMQPVENYGVKMLSIGFFTKPGQAVVWRGAMATKALQQLIFDANWGELDFLLIDLPPGTGDIHLSLVQALPITGVVVVSTPQSIALADAAKGVDMFQMDAINVPVLGVVENMSYFTPAELPNNKYYIFGKEGAKHLAEDVNVPFLGEIPLVQSVREAGDVGRPAALQEGSAITEAFDDLTKRVVEEVVKRNDNLPETEVVKITTMAGCSAVKK